MAQIDTTSLTRWNLTEEEFKAGSQLTQLQRCIIQNAIAECSELRLALDFDPTDPTKFAQDEAFLKGQIKAYSYLLDCDDANKASEEKIVM